MAFTAFPVGGREGELLASQQGAWSEDITRQEEPGGVGGVRRCKGNFWRRCSQDSESGWETPAPGGEGVTAIQVFVIFQIQLLDKVSVHST